MLTSLGGESMYAGRVRTGVLDRICFSFSFSFPIDCVTAAAISCSSFLVGSLRDLESRLGVLERDRERDRDLEYDRDRERDRVRDRERDLE